MRDHLSVGQARQQQGIPLDEGQDVAHQIAPTAGLHILLPAILMGQETTVQYGDNLLEGHVEAFS